MFFKSNDFGWLVLVSFLIVGGLSAPFRNWGSTQLELLFDPDPIKNHLTMVDDYGVRPIPPHVPPNLVHGQSTYQPALDEEYF